MDCKICGEECTNIKQIQEHEKEQHTIATEFKCEDCERIFKSEKKLRFNEMFEMDDSDKIYKYEGLLNKICSSIFKCKICECEGKGENKSNSFKHKLESLNSTIFVQPDN